MKNQSLKFVLPEIVQENFEIEEVEEKEREIIIHLKEKKEKIPAMAEHRCFDKKIVLNGYRPAIEIIDHSLKGKLTYLRIKRRRWKIEGSQETYENHYRICPKGLKCTLEFGNFLKELTQRKRHKFFAAWPDIRHIREEDFQVVSNFKRLFRSTSSEGKNLPD